CSSDLVQRQGLRRGIAAPAGEGLAPRLKRAQLALQDAAPRGAGWQQAAGAQQGMRRLLVLSVQQHVEYRALQAAALQRLAGRGQRLDRSEEHTSELQSRE